MGQYEQNKKFGTDLRQIIESNLPLQKWGFEHSFEDFGDNVGLSFRRIIFDSEWCRVKFQYSFRGFPETNELGIYYGRLHAPSANHLMTQNGENYYCWHGIGWTHIYFLDGFTPSEAVEINHNGTYPEVMDKIFKSELSIKLQKEPIPKRFIIMESIKWDFYGVRFFELFDLRHPDIWEKYIEFLKEFYRLEEDLALSKGYKPFTFNPPQYKIL